MGHWVTRVTGQLHASRQFCCNKMTANDDVKTLNAIFLYSFVLFSLHYVNGINKVMMMVMSTLTSHI